MAVSKSGNVLLHTQVQIGNPGLGGGVFRHITAGITLQSSALDNLQHGGVFFFVGGGTRPVTALPIDIGVVRAGGNVRQVDIAVLEVALVAKVVVVKGVQCPTQWAARAALKRYIDTGFVIAKPVGGVAEVEYKAVFDFVVTGADQLLVAVHGDVEVVVG